MIKLKYYLQRPGKGFDPVPLVYAQEYANAEYAKFDPTLVDRLEAIIRSYKGKSLLDLGGGPGQYSLEFAKRGADVTWHDISRNYLAIAKQKAEKYGYTVDFSLGYLDDAAGQYDIVFNRICWYYCLDDHKFADLVYSLIKKGGCGFIIANNESFLFEQIKKMPLFKRIPILLSQWLNEKFNIKLIHVHPSHTKLKSVFSRFKLDDFLIERIGNNTLIILKK